MKRSSILVAAALSLFSVITVQACSGDEGDDDNDTMTPGLNPGTGGTAPVTGTGGAAPVATNGGTGNVAEGQGGAPVATNGGTTGTSPVSNMGGAPAGLGGAPTAMGGAPAGMGGTPPVTGAPPACIEPPAPSNGTACTVTCTDPCSVHALGSRVCTCAGVYACATCTFANPNNPLIATPTAPLTPCPLDDSALEDATGCVEPERCESIRVNGAGELSRFCACQAGKWDCDSKPSNFP